MKVVDMHCDTISALWHGKKDGKVQSLRKNDLHIDLEKLQKGDYLLQNLAMFVFLGKEPDPLVNVLELIDVYEEQLKANQDLIAPVLCYEDIEKNAQAGKISALLTLEEGAVFKGDPAVVRALYRLGARMATLTWNFENELGFPGISPQNEPLVGAEYGLKPAGIEIVREMNRLGMIVDVSHLGDAGFWDVVKYSESPFVASHSNARAICGHNRNLTDEMIKALADKGGVMGINFCGDFLNPGGSSRVEDMVRHIQHIRDVGGIDCIGLGTDYDGIDGELELYDASQMQRLCRGLEQAGFRTPEIEAIFHGNVLRVYKEVLS